MKQSSKLALILGAAVSSCTGLGAQARPRPPYVCENCWPTECLSPCTWVVTRPIRTVQSPTDSAAASLEAAPGDSLEADSSLVRVTQFGLAIMRNQGGSYRTGDTLVVTFYDGEGHYRIWHRGAQRLERQLWGNDAAPARLLVPLRQEWWARVRRASRVGWLRLVPDSAPARSADGC